MGVITCACNPAPVRQLCPFGLLSSQHSLLGEDEANKRHCLKNRVDSFLRITPKPGLWLPNVYTGQQASTATHRQSHTHTHIHKLTNWNFLPGCDQSRRAFAQNRANLRSPGVSSGAGQCSQERQTHPGSSGLLGKIYGYFPGAIFYHVEQGQLRGHGSITEYLNPIPLASWRQI